MIGDIIEIANAAGTLLSNASDSVGKTVNATTKLAGSYADAKMAVMSIAEKSKRSIMMYKVWMSASIRETELALQINKWLESMYGVFTMLVLGFNPMANSNDDVKQIINSVSAESFVPNYNTKATEAAFARDMVVLDSERKTSKPRIGKNATVSTEANNPPTSNNEFVSSSFANRIQSSTTNAYPTIINMNVHVNGGTVAVPLAIKCNIYPIGTEETRLLIESGISGKMLDFMRKVKWRSGEISTLAWIFNTDIAEKSKKLYEKLGRNPMFQELQMRKAASKKSFWGKFLTRFGADYESDDDSKKAYKTLNANIANVPPTSSLIVSKDDIVAATRLNIEHFTKNEGFVNRFMKDNFLLCLGIVDHAAMECTFFMMGYKTPFKFSFDALKTNGSDPNKALNDTLKLLASKV